jgi:hypothetical protein
VAISTIGRLIDMSKLLRIAGCVTPELDNRQAPQTD